MRNSAHGRANQGMQSTRQQPRAAAGGAVGRLSQPTIAAMLLTSDDLRITIEPGRGSAKPCIRGIWITLSDTLGSLAAESLAAGMSVDEILSDFPELTAEDIHACLAFAAERERRLLIIPAA